MKHKICILAGEPSGDMLGAHLIKDLKQKGVQANFMGIAGPMMEEAGCGTFFPMEDITVMGFTELIPRFFKLKNRFSQTVKAILSWQPDLIITIDNKGFNFRVVEAVKSTMKAKCIHYVAPSMWAMNKASRKRLEQMANLYDEVMCLWQFEPRFFRNLYLEKDIKCKLPLAYVGHPMTKMDFTSVRPIKKKICVLPGSRKMEVKRLLPIFMKAVGQLNGEFEIVIPTLSHLEPYIRSIVKDNVTIVTQDRQQAMQSCHLALAASGSVTYELACLGVPTIVAYKLSRISAWIARRILNIPYVSIVNLLTNREVVKEYLQERCTPRQLSEALQHLIDDTYDRRAIKSSYRRLIRTLQAEEHATPAEVVLQYIS